MLTVQTSTILFADAQDAFRDGLADYCEAAGDYQVVARCSDGYSALERARHFRPDVAVLDANLPGLSVQDLLTALRSLGHPLRSVVLSTRHDRPLLLAALRGGVNGLVWKSGPPERIVEAVNQVLNGGVYLDPYFSLPVLAPAFRRKTEDPLESLSSREYQVFVMMVDGVRAKEIATRLQLSPKTIDTYRASLMRKLCIQTVPELVKFAVRRNVTA